MDALANAVSNVDSPYSLIALAIVGMYALLWRWGGKMLDAVKENTRLTKENKVVAVEAKAKAANIEKSIITNHGSKNLGDAVDRLTAWLLEHMEESKHGLDQLHTLQSVVVASAVESEEVRNRIVERFTEVDELLERLEKRLTEIEAAKN